MEKVLELAKTLAQQIHTGHKRLSGESYAEHTLRVHNILLNRKVSDTTTLTASILHHSLDISKEPESVIQTNFGKDTLNVIKGYKKLKETKIDQNAPGHFNEKYVMQTYINMSNDIRVLAIRIADKTDNLLTSWALPKEKRNEIAQKALTLYSPLARIVGLGKMAANIEDAAFKILLPGEYKNIQTIEASKKELREAQQIAVEILSEQGINATVQTRVKHLYGIFRKANYYAQKDKFVGKSYEGIHDVIAMRVLLDSIEDCYRVENIFKDLWDYLDIERNDYITNPRKSGYKAIHDVFKISKKLALEIQIKTHLMYQQSEFGPASHLMYKIGDKSATSMAIDEFKKYIQENPFWFKDLNFWIREKELTDFRPNTPFSRLVYAFTPKGDIIELPKGSTTIDFAYAVHTDLGNSCIGAFANSQMVKLDYQVKDGDYIEIKTLHGKKPSKDWLKFVKTQRARHDIKKYSK